jgi:pimeloyl-ACP methyl ester carboxylesterase
MGDRTTSSFVENGGVRLYVESTGSGTPIVFVHELAGDLRNWQGQVAFLSGPYRCVTYNARGYPPSDVPEEPAGYSQAHAVSDLAAVVRNLGLGPAHVVGLSMGGYAALNAAIAHPGLVRSVTVAGTGHGSDPATRESFLAGSAGLADRVERLGLVEGAAEYLRGPTRSRFAEKDPEGFALFNRQIADHSPLGTVLTIRGYQLRRPTLQDLEPQLAVLAAPALVIAGDDDGPCVAAGLFLKRTIPDARLCLLPRTTHSVNLEEPDAFNRVLADFLSDVDQRHPARG